MQRDCASQGRQSVGMHDHSEQGVTWYMTAFQALKESSSKSSSRSYHQSRASVSASVTALASLLANISL